MTRPMNIDSFERATSRPWSAWVDALDRAGARGLPHAEIVPLVLADIDASTVRNPHWWAQGITIAYEQHIGRRIPGQRGDGTFAGSVSKTYPGSMDEALTAWLALVEGRGEFLGLGVDVAPSTSTTEKWRYWRCGLEDGSKVTVTVNAVAGTGSAPGKSRVAVEHGRLPSPEAAAESKTWWRGLLAGL